MSSESQDVAAGINWEILEQKHESGSENGHCEQTDTTTSNESTFAGSGTKTLNELKCFRIQRKRENEDNILEDMALLKSPTKQFKLENHVKERKSIIEVCLNSVASKNDDLDLGSEAKPDLKIDASLLRDIRLIDILETVREVTTNNLDKSGQLSQEMSTEGQKETKGFLSQEERNAIETVFTKLCEHAGYKTSNIKEEIKLEPINIEAVSSKTIITNNFNNTFGKTEQNTALQKTKVDIGESNVSTDVINRMDLNKETTNFVHNFYDGSNNSQNEHNFDYLEQLTPEEEVKDDIFRKSCKPFLQHLPCFKLKINKKQMQVTDATLPDAEGVKSKIHKCRECRRRTPHQGSNDVYCRFYEFRCLQYSKDGQLLVSGFPNPYKDPTPDEIKIWRPDQETDPTAGNMDIQVCRYILLHVGDQFCYLWRQEAEALKLHENPNCTIAWKKVVQGIREICDVCDTTLFNYHWTCDKCGFGVCLDCFKDRKEKRTVRKNHGGEKTHKGRDEYYWLLCSGGLTHHMKNLMLTQIIAGDSLNILGRLLHDIRTLWQIPQLCGCLMSQQCLPNGEMKDLIQDMINESQLKQQTSASSLATDETLRKQDRLENIHIKALEFAKANGIDYVPGRMHSKQTLGKDPITCAFDNFSHINFLRKGLAGLRRFLPPRAMTLAHSSLIAPDVPHEWACDGKLLRLTKANHPDNRILFQEVWKCGQPVMISEVAKSLNLDLWRPEAFLKDFGEKPNDLINCLNGNLVPNQPMRHFWEGFQCMKKRLLDANGKPMLLKLKDWPPGDDFAEILPTRYKDLMKGLPMPEYTLRTGHLNIASCLPKMFVPPDLGPKMYNAYGSAFYPDKGTTNLHLDISDAVNIMVYVGIPEDSDSKSQVSASHKAIAMGGCEFLTRSRVLNKHVVAGALWHIFPARDADKIRDLLNRVTLEKGYRLEPDHDPIHDQNWYLDDKLRARLFKDYGVEGYSIVQCLGDAIFIPAGAPHQVQNLHNCIKVAEDFVSPENITHCYHLTHEFRRLSHSHTNHEDKLQIKNIIYHAIKDCCTILTRSLESRLDLELYRAEQIKNKLEMRAEFEKQNSNT